MFKENILQLKYNFPGFLIVFATIKLIYCDEIMIISINSQLSAIFNLLLR